MKTNASLLSLTLALGALSVARAQLTIPGDGSDGDLNPAQNVEVDLSQAITGNWSDAVPAASAGKGIYDPIQRAVVFKYHSVTVPAGVSVTFKNHPTRSPVVWLVQQNVTIIGPGTATNAAPAVNLNGKPGAPGSSPDSRIPTEPGPGGFRGAAGFGLNSAGLGWGGGAYFAHGTYANVYGNPRLLRLVGGSGGGGGNFSASGSGGGGAILIACSGTLTLSGKITANGGTSPHGSGGGIRLVADTITGTGTVEAIGQSAAPPYAGRIRIETNSMPPTITTVPSAIPETPPAAPVIWPPSNTPKARILRVAAANAPADPVASLTNTADIGIQNNGSVEIEVETTNFPTTGQVVIRAAAKTGTPTGGGSVLLSATLVAGGTTAQATWKATHTFVNGFTTLQARAIVP